MIIVLMGVTGSGKTTVGRLLAQQLSWQFVDGDEFHPAANIAKMRQGIALTDSDREPWLDSIREAILTWVAESESVVLACSALKEKYRSRLQVGPAVKLVYLRGSYDVIYDRLQERHGHFATATLLASQFGDLEEPSDALIVDLRRSPEEIVSNIRLGLRL